MSLSLINITSSDQLKEHVASGDVVIVHFWADWCRACGPLNSEILPGLMEQYPKLRVLNVEAEKQPALSQAHKVTVVPSFLIYARSSLKARVEGAKTADLARAVASAVEASAAQPKQQGGAAGATATPEARTKAIINSDGVVLFMKGTPQAPQCGFSRKIVALLAEQGVSYSSFNILEDPEVRAAHKVVADWPTFPALHAEGKLLGGLDIIKEMAAEDELLDAIPESHKLKK